MIKIILIGNDEKNYAVVKRTISELDFLYNDELKLIRFSRVCQTLKDEVLSTDHKKIYIINVKLVNQTRRFNVVKFIRENDWNSEIILLKDKDAILDKTWQGINKIFDIIDISNKDETILKNDLSLIFKHNCDSKTFNYKNRDVNLNIYFEKILYIYRDTGERKVVVVTDNNIYTLNMGLKDAFYLLDKRFKQVHRACVVNTMRTEKFDWSKNSFTLDNGEEVNLLSKNYRSNISDTIDI